MIDEFYFLVAFLFEKKKKELSRENQKIATITELSI